MKGKIKKIFIHSVPVFSALLLFFFSFSFVSAAEYVVYMDAGHYIFNPDIQTPGESFDVLLAFECNGVDYKSIHFKSSDPELAVPSLYFDNTLVCTWSNGTASWEMQAYRVVLVRLRQRVPGSFYSWLALNSSYKYFFDGDLPGYDQSQDINSALDNLETLDQYLNQLPDPDLSGTDFGVGNFLSQSYQTFTSVLEEIWSSPLISSIMATIAAFVLVSYLIFAGKG